MTKESISNLLRLSVMLATFSLLTACATPAAKDKSADAAPAQAAAVEIEPWEGDPMEMPLDGSSTEAFKNSLARFKAHASPEQVNGLNNAIDYLAIYDIASKGDRDVLYSRLDGMTPLEIMNLVSYRTPGPGKSAIEKDAADLQPMDSGKQ